MQKVQSKDVSNPRTNLVVFARCEPSHRATLVLTLVSDNTNNIIGPFLTKTSLGGRAMSAKQKGIHSGLFIGSSDRRRV